MSTESRKLTELVARWERQILFACGKTDRMNDLQRTTMQECLDDLKAALATQQAEPHGRSSIGPYGRRENVWGRA